MKALTEKIMQECNISKMLRQAAWDANFSQSQEIRKKQQEHWERFTFWKELSKALEKKGVEQNGRTKRTRTKHNKKTSRNKEQREKNIE